MSKNKWFYLMTAVLVLTLLFVAGCGDDEAAPDAPDATDDDIVIRVATGAVGMEFEVTERQAQAYMDDNPGVIVEILSTPDMVEDRLGIYLQFFEARSSEVDLYQIDVVWPGDLAEHFLDFYDYGAADIIDDHFPAIVENNTVDGRLVGLPWFTDAGLLYYRTDLLQKYGLQPPQTWDELEEYATIIQEGERAENPDFWGFVWQGNAYEGLTCDALEWIYSNDGGTIISPEGVITINNPNAIEIIDQAAGWVGTISPEGVTTMAEEDSRAVWHAGNAAFMRNWPYAYSATIEQGSAIKDDFDVSPLPAGRSGSGAATLGGWQLGLSAYSENPAVAADVAMFLASPEGQKQRAIEASLNPTIMSVYEDEEVLAATPFFGTLYNVFINAVARPSTATAPQYSAVSELFFRAVHDVLIGQRSAADAFEELELDLEDLTGFPTE